MPSYRRCAIIMVRFTLKRSLREESCCSLLVVNGGVALRRRSFFSAERTTQSAFSSALAEEARVECRRLGGGQIGVDRPVFFFLEGFDFAFAIDDQAQCYGLHPAGGKTAADLVPQKRRDLVANEAIQHASSLLRVDQFAVDVARMLESGFDGPLCDLVKGHPANARLIADVVSLFLGALFSLLFLNGIFAEFVGEMGGDGFAFAIRVRRKVDMVG